MKAPYWSNYFGLLPSLPAPQAEDLLALKEKEIQSLKYCYLVHFTQL